MAIDEKELLRRVMPGAPVIAGAGLKLDQELLRRIYARGRHFEQRLGLSVLRSENRRRLALQNRTSNEAINQRYQAFLTKYKIVAERSLGPEVLAGLGRLSGAMASLRESTSALEGALLQGAVDAGAAIRQDNGEIDKLLERPDPQAVVPGYGKVMLRTLFAKSVGAREGKERSDENRAARQRQLKERMAAKIGRARGQLRDTERVLRLKAGAKDGPPRRLGPARDKGRKDKE